MPRNFQKKFLRWVYSVAADGTAAYAIEIGPLKYSCVWGNAVNSPNGVWGGPPAEIEFGAF